MPRGTRPNRIAQMEREIASTYRRRIDELEAAQRGLITEHSHHVSKLHAELGDLRIELDRCKRERDEVRQQRDHVAWLFVGRLYVVGGP